uniref:NADH dehydrogenase subunit 2 n=1 Tax=Lima vulgaris TaxID=2671060 RepID=UPI0028FCAA61|nr:NADH dehydrogenase subunit 2 [Lima vulgaris]WNB40320.1 NADH dehydrogenase subunit 2 [Lima vulgaris]
MQQGFSVAAQGFLGISVMSALASLSCSSMVGVWFWMELGVLSFFPFMTMRNGETRAESAITYFFSQVVGSMGVLVYLMSVGLYGFSDPASSVAVFGLGGLVVGLLVKVGVAPFHGWVPLTVSGTGWQSLMMMLSVQKIVPWVVLVHLAPSWFVGVLFVAGVSAVWGGIGGSSEGDVRSILGWSGVSQGGWCLAAGLDSDKAVGVFYVVVYLFHVFISSLLMSRAFSGSVMGDLGMSSLASGSWSVRYCAVVLFLSLSGVPPMLGFFSKFLVVGSLTWGGYGFVLPALFTGAVLSSFFYLRMGMLFLSPSRWSWRRRGGFGRDFSLYSFMVMCIFGGVIVFLWALK